MLISKKWLQSYFDGELPSMQKIADTLLLHSFEIEGLEEVNNDWVLDIDVLPNRAHDCLCHDGVARELSGLLNIPLKESRYSNEEYKKIEKTISVDILNDEQCTRYIATVVNNIEVRESPDWLKSRLESMGQKSINALVDATNYIMFDLGQPMHVFDAEKVSGDIVVRNATEGEKMTTLSGEELELLDTDLVIADTEKVLALAGVKGGNAAEVTDDTKNIIIESAHFNPLTTRKTARRVKILTDSSKRYENEISAEKTSIATEAMKSLVLELAGTDETAIAESVDVYKKPEELFSLEFTAKHTARLLGFEITESEIDSLLERFKYSYENNKGNYIVTIPADRLDLRIPVDMIEEIGRLYGYHAIPVKSLDEFDFNADINKTFYTAQKLRNYFVENGFTEIMNYTFVNKGEIEMFNPVASDKKALRKNLSKQMKDSIEKNARIADFLHVDQVLNFEIDVVHINGEERMMCCFGIDTLSKKSRKQYGTVEVQIKNTISAIKDIFGLENLDFQVDSNIVSFDLEQCLEADSVDYGNILDHKSYGPDARFVGISVYPYIKRDISFWADTVDVVVFETAIKNAGAEYLQKVSLFDQFEKEGRTSYAFSMVFQSFEKTLTDIEVDADMDKINSAVINLGGEIR